MSFSVIKAEVPAVVEVRDVPPPEEMVEQPPPVSLEFVREASQPRRVVTNAPVDVEEQREPRPSSGLRARSGRARSATVHGEMRRRPPPVTDIDDQIATVSAAAIEALGRAPTVPRGASLLRQPSHPRTQSLQRSRTPGQPQQAVGDEGAAASARRVGTTGRIDWDYDLRVEPVRSPNSEGGSATAGFDAHPQLRTKFFSFANLLLAYQSLGVVFGDLGTSPLYTLPTLGILPRSGGENGTGRPFTAHDALVSTSAIVWLVMIVVFAKYVLFVMAADFHGEGGTFALVSMLRAVPTLPMWFRSSLLVVGLMGSAMVVADGAITPAISVLSALEGLRTVNDSLQQYVVPISIAVLVLLFAIQPFGTYKVSFLLSPIMFLWFVSLAMLGLYNIIKLPSVLIIFSPHLAVQIFNKPVGEFMASISTVMLSVTGVEALYADLAHFGRKGITTATCGVVLPALLLAYTGQAAALQSAPERIEDSFFLMVPDSLRIPMVVLATLAAIAASQALITAAFSICKQAVAVDCFPRVRIVHTSNVVAGQVYVPLMNLLLFVISIALTAGFQSSARLGALFGVAVAFLMFVTVMLMFPVCRAIWKWNYFFTILVCGLFGIVHLLLLVSCFIKFVDGAWIPFCFSISLATIMGCWLAGRRAVRRASNESEPPLPLSALVPMVTAEGVYRPAGSVAVFVVRSADNIPIALSRLATKHLRTVAERIIILEVAHVPVPFIPPEHRLVVRPVWIPPGCDVPAVVSVRMFVGYVELPQLDLHEFVLARLQRWVGAQEGAAPTYFIEDENLIADDEAPWYHRAWVWFFMLMAQNCSNLNSYDLPLSDTMATSIPLII